VWSEDRYHLFYQALPERVTWAPQTRWGHAQSRSLGQWQEQATALTPEPFETGCWSGSAVLDTSGAIAALLYTRIVGDSLAQGQIAVARLDADGTRWSSSEDDRPSASEITNH
jgi:beta-fructofuranosidase